MPVPGAVARAVAIHTQMAATVQPRIDQLVTNDRLIEAVNLRARVATHQADLADLLAPITVDVWSRPSEPPGADADEGSWESAEAVPERADSREALACDLSDRLQREPAANRTRLAAEYAQRLIVLGLLKSTTTDPESRRRCLQRFLRAAVHPHLTDADLDPAVRAGRATGGWRK